MRRGGENEERGKEMFVNRELKFKALYNTYSGARGEN